MTEVKNLSFAEGTAVTAPTLLSTNIGSLGQYALDADFVTAKGSVAVEGDIYYNTTEKTAKIYDGSVWTAVGSGSGQGELNYITNHSGAIDTSGWTESTDTEVDIVQTSTASELPRENLTGTGLKITGGSGTTVDYVSYAFTLDDADVSKKMKISFSKKDIATYAAGELTVTVYDITNSVTITPATTDIPEGTGEFLTSFDTTNSLSYELRINKPATGATVGIVISDVIVGPGKVVQGAIVTEWESYTPSGSLTTNVTYTGVKRREGDTGFYEVAIDFSGTNTQGIPTIVMPSGETIDASKLTSTDAGGSVLMGSGSMKDNTGGAHSVVLPTYQTSTQIRLMVGSASGTYSAGTFINTSTNIPFIFNSGDRILVKWEAPIAEWAGSGTLNVGTNDVEYAYNTSTSTTDDTTSFGYGALGKELESFAPSGNVNVTKRIRFKTAKQVTDNIELELWDGTGWSLLSDRLGSFQVNDAGTTSYGVLLDHINSTDVDVNFYSSAPTQDAWSVFAGLNWNWRVKKTKAGSAVGFGLASATESGLVKKNKWQLKTYSGTATSATDLITFNNLVTGKLYRLSAQVRGNAAGLNRARIREDGNILGYLEAQEAGGSDYASCIFVASGTVATLDWLSGTLSGGGTNDQTFAILEELANYDDETSDFT